MLNIALTTICFVIAVATTSRVYHMAMNKIEASEATVGILLFSWGAFMFLFLFCFKVWLSLFQTMSSS